MSASQFQVYSPSEVKMYEALVALAIKFIYSQDVTDTDGRDWRHRFEEILEWGGEL